MTNKYNKNESSDVSFSVLGLFKILNSAKIFILIFVSIVSLITAVYVYSLPDVYRAEVTLFPSEAASSGGLSSLSGQFGGLASLSGLNLQSESNKVAQFIELATSRSFIQTFIEKNQLLPYLYAVNYWDKESNQLVFDSSLFDQQNGEWLLSESQPKAPSAWQGYNVFQQMLNITENASTGMIKISLDYLEPNVAKQWLTDFINDLNSLIKEQDLIEAQESIRYLVEQAEISDIQAVKAVFYNLIEEKTKTILLANVNRGYVLKPLSSIVLPEDKNSPKRALLIVIISFLGLILAIIVALLRHLLNVERCNDAHKE